MALTYTAAQAQNFSEQAWISRFPAPVIHATTSAPGPLAGLQFAIKDNIDALGLPTTAACPAFSRSPAATATVVDKLLQAGAVLVGKTNLDQFACGLNGTRSPYGATPNAFNPLYVSGGSSAGSAYVVATGQVDFALGTDTAGSGRVPAGLNNIVGLKPSKGVLSTLGVLPAAQSVDCVSIFARTVATAAKVLESAKGFDPSDAYSRDVPMATTAWGSKFRFGVPSVLEFFGDTLAQDAFTQAIERLTEMGGTAVLIDYAPLAQTAALLYESALVAERYAAIRDFFDAHEADVIEPVRTIVGKGRSYSAADVFDAQMKMRLLGQKANNMWQKIDVLLVPTAPTHYTISAMEADPVVLNRNLGQFTNFVNLLDYAAISVPSSMRSDGLPFGITLIGQCGSDWQLCDMGQRYHHATDLPQGATGLPLPAAVPIAALREQTYAKIAVVGAHLAGMPLNSQLTERGATLVCQTETSADYRLYTLAGTVPPKPGMLRVPAGTGACIALEVWSLPVSQYGSFVRLIPQPLCIGTLNLADGTQVQGFVCEPQSLIGATDISTFGGWRKYIASLI